MVSAAAVVVCALGLLGRNPESFPRIVLVATAPPHASPGVEAFVQREPDTIYLITSTPVFRAALAVTVRTAGCPAALPLKKLASILVHEEWHLRNGPDEQSAYLAQLSALTMLGEPAGRPLYGAVQRSMTVALERRRAVP